MFFGSIYQNALNCSVLDGGVPTSKPLAVVVDGGSSDGTTAVAATLGAEVTPDLKSFVGLN